MQRARDRVRGLTGRKRLRLPAETVLRDVNKVSARLAGTPPPGWTQTIAG
jgi:hypothetical protein